MDQNQGLIAILDALGAASYGDREIAKFLESRERVLTILQQKAHAKEVRGEIERSAVSTFTFNDTVLIVFRTPAEPSLEDVEHFGLLLRKFAVDSLAQGTLFRGSLSIGKFYVEEYSSTVTGAAVTDAAAWYDAADWVGINATPHASMVIQALLEQSGGDAIGLIFTKVLDEVQLGLVDEDEEVQEPTDRGYWEEKGSANTVKLADRLVEMIQQFAPGYELKYNKHYIGLALKGRPNNFVAFRPQRTALRFEVKLPKSDETSKRLEGTGLEVLEYNRQWGYYKIRLSAEDVEKYRDLLTSLMKEAFDARV